LADGQKIEGAMWTDRTGETLKGSSPAMGMETYRASKAEALDKADAEFTAMAMNIFKTFGFQMVVATPLKSVMTLEPFIGGACFVHIKDRKKSALLPIDYDDATRRLKLAPHERHGEEITEP
jgi:hypothetical protein